ncbi:MAG: COX15/CtaA family protein [Candidatus Dormibacteria bacterium]
MTLATVVVTYLLIVAGGVVRVTGSGLGCGASGQDWPLCHGGLVPPPDLATLIEFNHRIFATLSTVLIAAVLVVAWLRYRSDRRVTTAASAAAVLLVVQILLGAVTVEWKLAQFVVLIHLANALLVLGVLIHLAVLVRRPTTDDEAPRATGRLPLIAAVSAYVLVLSGALVVADAAGGQCQGWPLCGNGFDLPVAGLAAINMAHRVVALAVVLFLGYAMAKIRRATADPTTRAMAMAVNVSLLLQVLAGAAVVESHLAAATRGLHIALASLVWGFTLAVALLAHHAEPRHGVRTHPASTAVRGAAA